MKSVLNFTILLSAGTIGMSRMMSSSSSSSTTRLLFNAAESRHGEGGHNGEGHGGGEEEGNIVWNTQCDISPDALTNEFQSNEELMTLYNPTNTEITYTCLESTGGYEGKRCYYTYIPDCATQNSPLVYDIHGMGLCPLWQFQTTGWINKAIENCFVIVWPMVSL